MSLNQTYQERLKQLAEARKAGQKRQRELEFVQNHSIMSDEALLWCWAWLDRRAFERSDKW
jgi:hypothetical protein